jgi:crossover junction endonuclease MUS81
LELGGEQAFENMLKFPEPLQTGKDAVQVPYIGKSIADRLERRLREHLGLSQNAHLEAFSQAQGVCQPVISLVKAHERSIAQTASSTAAASQEKSSKSKKPRKYVPALRSGAYAILLALLKNTNEGQFLSKKLIIDYGQSLCDASFTVPDPTNRYSYTAWNSIKILLEKELVLKTGNPPRFCLSDEGRLLAQSLDHSSSESTFTESSSTNINQVRTTEELNQSPISANKLSSLDLKSCRSVCRSESEFLEKYSWTKFNRTNYDIVLVLDNREINGKMDRQFFSQALSTRGVTVDVRPLHLGDTLWVAKNRITGEEVVLDYLIERKTMADLVASIKDGRYKEQKVRSFFLVEWRSESDSSISFDNENAELETLFIWWRILNSTRLKILAGLRSNLH